MVTTFFFLNKIIKVFFTFYKNFDYICVNKSMMGNY